jgi:hypothetical protein
MKSSMLKAWTLGSMILVVAYGAWFAALQAQTFSQVLVLLLWVSPVAAAFASAYFAPRTKFLAGLSMVVPAVVLTTLLNAAHQLLGNAADFSGIRGGLTLAMIALVQNLVLCAIGSGGGYFLTRNRLETR